MAYILNCQVGPAYNGRTPVPISLQDAAEQSIWSENMTSLQFSDSGSLLLRCVRYQSRACFSQKTRKTTKKVARSLHFGRRLFYTNTSSDVFLEGFWSSRDERWWLVIFAVPPWTWVVIPPLVQKFHLRPVKFQVNMQDSQGDEEEAGLLMEGIWVARDVRKPCT